MLYAACDRIKPMLYAACNRIKPMLYAACDRIKPMLYAACDGIKPMLYAACDRIKPMLYAAFATTIKNATLRGKLMPSNMAVRMIFCAIFACPTRCEFFLISFKDLQLFAAAK